METGEEEEVSLPYLKALNGLYIREAQLPIYYPRAFRVPDYS